MSVTSFQILCQVPRLLRRGELLATLHQLDEEEDINKVLKYFSYEHFYVIYCKVRPRLASSIPVSHAHIPSINVFQGYIGLEVTIKRSLSRCSPLTPYWLGPLIECDLEL